MTSFSAEQIRIGLSSANDKERWDTAEAAGDLIEEDPDFVWEVVRCYGSSPVEDTRTAIATCVLEHLLEKHFDRFFPLLETEVLAGNRLLGDTLRRCWRLGDASQAEHSERWNRLIEISRNPR